MINDAKSVYAPIADGAVDTQSVDLPALMVVSEILCLSRFNKLIV